MIIGFSGKKQSGKNTSCNFCLGTFMWQNGIIENTYRITDSGKLSITDLYGDTEKNGIIDTSRQDPALQAFLKERVYPISKIYSMADPLKEMCINVLGLTYEQCYGTDEQKDSPTRYTWADMPRVICSPADFPSHENGDLITVTWESGYNTQMYYHNNDVMTAREIMQYFGTEVYRNVYENIWADALISKTAKERSKFPLVCDVRFPNEVEAIQKAGGVVVRLTKNIVDDDHFSENALNDYTAFDFTIKNDDMTIAEQNSAIMQILLDCGVEFCI